MFYVQVYKTKQFSIKYFTIAFIMLSINNFRPTLMSASLSSLKITLIYWFGFSWGSTSSSSRRL